MEKLKELCKSKYGYMFDDEDIIKGEHGKPYFKENKLFFNISHSKGMGAIVLDESECGIDIEKMRNISFKMADRFFADDEKDWINQVRGEEQAERFFKVWTGKEAYTKMLGCGLTVPMDSFSVLDENISCMLEYMKEKDYIICVCRK